jgi:hypothetical protein
MNNSRTSTSKKNIKTNNNKKNIRTSPSTTSTKKVQKSNTKSSNNKKINNSAINKNMHSSKNNLRLNKVVDDTEYVPFIDDNVQEIRPNRIRKVEPDNIHQKEKKNKIKIKPITIIKVTFFIAILIGIIYSMFNLEIFNLAEIKVKGNEKYTSDNIIANSNLKIGENIFKQLFLNGKNEIDLSYISKTSFRYSFPSTIVISVKERYPAYIALDKNTGNYYKIDNNGYLLEQCELSQKKDEVLIEGFVFEENVKFGKKIDDVYLKKLEVYNNIKDLIEQYEIEGNITKVNFSNSLTIISLDDKLRIIFANDSNIEYKVSFLKGIIQKNGGIVEGSIDMSIENPVYSKYD